MSRPLRLLLLALPLLLAACPRGVRFGPEGEITDPEYLLRRLEANASRIRSVKGEARAAVKTPQQSGTVGQFAAALRPASLHLETLNFFGKPIAALATDGARFTLFLEEEASFYSGPASAANVGRLLPLPVEPAEVVSLLLGEVPRLEGAQATLEVDRDARAYRLTLTRGALRQQIWLGTEDLRPLRSQRRGAPGYDLEFSDYQVIDQQLFPMVRKVRAVAADGSPTGNEIELRFRDLELNVALDPALFRLEPPPGARTIALDAEGEVTGPATPAP